MSHISPISDDALYDTYATDGRIDNLARKILNPKRGKPIVLLTARQGERVPAMDPEFVRQVVGPDVEVCFVPRADLTKQLEELLPPKLHAFGGAVRIYWPHVNGQSNPTAHPFIYDPNGTYGSLAEQRFREHWEKGGLSKREATTEDPQLVLLRQERDKAVKDRDEALAEQGRLQQALRLRDERIKQLQADLVQGRKDHRSELSKATAADGQGSRGDLAPADQLRREIHAAYLDSIPESQREEFPLGAFRFHPEFIESVIKLERDVRRKLPEVCAQVACGIAPRVDGREVHRYRATAAGGSPDRIRESDGAIAMRCAIQRGTPSAPRLHYWVPDNAPLEFVAAVLHDDDRFPE